MKNYRFVFFVFLAVTQVKADSANTECFFNSEDDVYKKSQKCFERKYTSEIETAKLGESDIEPIKGLSFDASTENKKAIVTLEHLNRKNTIQLTLQRSFENNFESAEYLNLDGIPSETKVTASWKRIFRVNGTESIEVKDLFEEKYNEVLERTRKLREAQCLLADKAKPENKEKCDEADKEWAEYTQKTHIVEISEKPVITWSSIISLSYLQTPHKHFDFTKSEAVESKHDGFELSLGLSKLSSANLAKWDFSLGFQKGKEAGFENSTKNFCTVVDGNDAITTCAEAYELPVVEVEKFVPSITYTKKYKEGNFVKGIQIAVKHFVSDTELRDDGSGDVPNNTTVSIPVHLVNFSETLSGGVKFSHNTHPSPNVDKFNMGLYMSAPLTVF